MAVKKITTPEGFIGATGEQPTDGATSVRPGATFYDKDTGLLYITYDGTSWVIKSDFSGNVYSKTMTMEDNNAARFETTAKKLRDIVISVETHPMLLGGGGVEVYTVGVGGTLGFTKIDISTLYFKNAGAGNNGKITILGVEE